MEQIMSRRISPQLSLKRKTVLFAAGVAALAAPIAAGVLNVPILKAQSQLWAPASDAPTGLLTALEGKRHDQFIGKARAGDIDIVFFGSTPTEMWLWQDRGRSVWDRTFGSLKAASFGSQGTRFESLMWRMQHGELDGYRAKLVVLHAENRSFAGQDGRAPWFGGTPITDSGLKDYVSKYAAIIAEIRSRQPQARILLFGVFPRYQTDAEPALENAALAALANNETIFFIDISKRFFHADGSFDGEMWHLGTTEPGIQRPAFEVWAQTLQPWLDRFVR
jgi:beta-glucosidase